MGCRRDADRMVCNGFKSKSDVFFEKNAIGKLFEELLKVYVFLVDSVQLLVDIYAAKINRFSLFSNINLFFNEKMI
jgi:hypothetical protein